MTALLDFTTASSLVLNGLRTRDSSFAATVNRISTGVRLTTMSDDVAAWMVGVRTDNRQRGWNEAGQNIQNGLSLLETADGGAESIYTALSRLRELAVQAATGTYSGGERQAIQGEVEALRQQVFDTVQSTQFNGRKLLAGTSRQDPSTVDLGNLTTLASTPGYTSATQTGQYDVEITQAARQAALRGNQQAQPLVATDADTTMTLSTELGTVSVNLTFATTPNPSDWVTAITGAAGGIGVTAEITNALTTLDDGVTLVDPAGLGFLMLRSANTGSTATLGVLTNTLVDKFGFSITGASQQGLDMQGTLNGVAFTTRGLTITAGAGARGASGLSFAYTAEPPLTTALDPGFIDVVVPAEIVTDVTHVVQVAPDHLDEYLISLPALRVDALDDAGVNTLGTLDLTTQAGAQAALDVLDSAMSQVLVARGVIGKHMQALDYNLALAASGAYASASAESRIMDADMAVETTNLVQDQMAQQVGRSVLEALHAQSSASLDFVVRMLQNNPLSAAA